MTLNLWLKTDDFPFNTPLGSPLSWVLPGAVTAPQLFLFHNKSPPTIHPPHTQQSLHIPPLVHLLYSSISPQLRPPWCYYAVSRILGRSVNRVQGGRGGGPNNNPPPAPLSVAPVMDHNGLNGRYCQQMFCGGQMIRQQSGKTFTERIAHWQRRDSEQKLRLAVKSIKLCRYS